MAKKKGGYALTGNGFPTSRHGSLIRFPEVSRFSGATEREPRESRESREIVWQWARGGGWKAGPVGGEGGGDRLNAMPLPRQGDRWSCAGHRILPTELPSLAGSREFYSPIPITPPLSFLLFRDVTKHSSKRRFQNSKRRMR